MSLLITKEALCARDRRELQGQEAPPLWQNQIAFSAHLHTLEKLEGHALGIWTHQLSIQPHHGPSEELDHGDARRGGVVLLPTHLDCNLIERVSLMTSLTPNCASWTWPHSCHWLGKEQLLLRVYRYAGTSTGSCSILCAHPTPGLRACHVLLWPHMPHTFSCLNSSASWW